MLIQVCFNKLYWSVAKNLFELLEPELNVTNKKGKN